MIIYIFSVNESIFQFYIKFRDNILISQMLLLTFFNKYFESLLDKFYSS